MRRLVLRVVGFAIAAPALGACGFADIRAPVPEFMRAKAPEPVAPEAPPDVKQLLRDDINAVFTAASRPANVRASPPRHAPQGNSWTACVRADLNSVTGRPLGPQTYRLTITESRIADRRRADEDDNCVSESYEPI
jgi:hypothetical protein